MKMQVLAVGKLKGAYRELCDEYAGRLGNALAVREIPASTTEAEGTAIASAIPDGAWAVALDERGEDLSSRELAAKIAKWQESRAKGIVFVVGGAGGLSEKIKSRADFTLGLGRKTWPHRLARVMLIEQIYRAIQITAGHPYHHE